MKIVVLRTPDFHLGRGELLCNQPAQPNKFMSQHLVELYHTQDVATPSDAKRTNGFMSKSDHVT
jgi:hypothetical protein